MNGQTILKELRRYLTSIESTLARREIRISELTETLSAERLESERLANQARMTFAGRRTAFEAKIKALTAERNALRLRVDELEAEAESRELQST